MLKKATELHRQGGLLVEVIPYNHSLLATLRAMLASQNYMGIEQIENETLPEFGYIAVKTNESDLIEPIAAGFLRRLEGGFAQFDTLVSNAKMPSKDRHEGISAVIDSLTNKAKELNIRGILATTEDKSVIVRAKSLGFRVVDNLTVIAMPLKRESHV